MKNVKLKYAPGETVFAVKSGKKGVVETAVVSAKGVEYGVRNDGAKTKAFRYAEGDLESASANAAKVAAKAKAEAAARKAKEKALADKVKEKAKADKAKKTAKPKPVARVVTAVKPSNPAKAAKPLKATKGG